MAIIAVLATAGAIVAGIAHRHNASRAARYAEDPTCQASFVSEPQPCPITLIEANGLTAQTEWNPVWEKGNTEIGVWFLGTIALLSLAGLLWIRARALREARASVGDAL